MPSASFSLALVLAVTPPTLFPARELSSGLVVDADGQTVEVRPGACYVPEARCVDYVRECERAKASEAELAKAPAPTGWVVVLVALAGLLAGFGAAQVLR
jgi:hypothetical protein